MSKKIIIILLIILAVAVILITFAHRPKDINIMTENTILKVYNNKNLSKAFDKSDDVLIATYSNQSDDDSAVIQKVNKIIMEDSGPFFDKDCDCLFIPYFRLEFSNGKKTVNIYLDSHYFIAIQNEKEIKRGTYYDNADNGINEVFDLLKLKMWE